MERGVSMRLPDEQEERGSGAAVMGSIAVVSVLILIILAVEIGRASCRERV